MNETRNMRTFLPLFSLLLCLTACSNNADEESVESNTPETIYHDFQVWAEEGSEEVTVRLQFRVGGKEGDAVLVGPPDGVLLDNLPLAVDSTKFTGVYYEALKPALEFTGKHTINFTDTEQQQQKVEFNFVPFSLASELPEEVPKQPFQIALKNFPDEPTSIRVVMIDTALHSADVNEEIVVENRKLTITGEHLANLTKGPVMLEIYREEETPLRNKLKTNGKLTLSYSLKRQFNLVE